MNLSALTLQELTDLQSALTLIRKGVGILAGLPENEPGVEIMIDITPGELVTVSTHFRMPGHFRAFGAPPPFDLISNDLSESPALVFGPSIKADGIFRVTPVTTSDTTQAARAPAATALDAGPILGPMTDAEKAEVIKTVWGRLVRARDRRKA